MTAARCIRGRVPPVLLLAGRRRWFEAAAFHGVRWDFLTLIPFNLCFSRDRLGIVTVATYPDSTPIFGGDDARRATVLGCVALLAIR